MAMPFHVATWCSLDCFTATPMLSLRWTSSGTCLTLCRSLWRLGSGAGLDPKAGFGLAVVASDGAVQESGVVLLADLAVPVLMPAEEVGPGAGVKLVGPAEASLAETVLLELGNPVALWELLECFAVIDSVRGKDPFPARPGVGLLADGAGPELLLLVLDDVLLLSGEIFPLFPFLRLSGVTFCGGE